MYAVERIINREEVGAKEFHYVNKKFYLVNNRLRPEEVEIEKVIVIKDQTEISTESMSMGARGIIGALLAGVVGVMVASLNSQPRWCVDIDIYLTDGRVVEIQTREEKTVRLLMSYIPKEDPRTAYRQERNVH